MSDYYQYFLSSMTAAGMNHPNGDPNDPNTPQPYYYPGGTMAMEVSPLQAPSGNACYFPGSQDAPTPPEGTKAGKGRSKGSAAAGGTGIEPVKHRRTRSGCFTCRSRRVKCDEARPVCARCKKGDRDCVYPDPPGTKGGSRSKDPSQATQQKSPVSSAGDVEEEASRRSKLETIRDEDESVHDAGTPALQTPAETGNSPPEPPTIALRQGSETPSLEDRKSSSPSASTVTNTSFATVPFQPSDYTKPPGGRADRSHLPSDIRYYLDWYDENASCYHFCLNFDPDDFFMSIYPNIALEHEPLLYALVGFAAYHVTIQNPNGKIDDFLQYYDKSVQMLLRSLKRREKHGILTLFTILQLATIEEYLGDWINLMGHQKAALAIFNGLFTPQNVMQTPLGRICLSWYARFDSFIAIMGGFPSSLDRDYFVAFTGFFQSQLEAHPTEIKWKIAEKASHIKRLGHDMSLLYARGCREQISPEEFAKQHADLTKVLDDWRNSWGPDLTDPKYHVRDFSECPPLKPDDLFNPYEVGLLYEEPLFWGSIMAVEWEATRIMHITQSPDFPSSQLLQDVGRRAYSLCQRFEALERWPGTPKGVIIVAQSPIQVAGLFLPPDPRYRRWLREKFAHIEQTGYIQPKARREKIAQLFGDPSLVRWWLPNDQGLPPVLESIREFADERNAAAVTAQQESVREVRHLFAKLDMSSAGQGAT